MTASKDPQLDRLIARLRENLGPDTFDVVDHWTDDPYATGLASPRDHHQLAYISILGGDEKIFCALEAAPRPGSDLPFENVGDGTDVNYAELLELIRAHLCP